MAKITVTYRTERAPDTVSLGAFAQIAAKRRFGLEAVKDGDPEPVLFGVLVELHGPQAAAADGGFDEWLQTVEDFSIAETDPTTAEETTSSASSPDSPPTSE